MLANLVVLGWNVSLSPREIEDSRTERTPSSLPSSMACRSHASCYPIGEAELLVSFMSSEEDGQKQDKYIDYYNCPTCPFL